MGPTGDLTALDFSSHSNCKLLLQPAMPLQSSFTVEVFVQLPLPLTCRYTALCSDAEGNVLLCIVQKQLRRKQQQQQGESVYFADVGILIPTDATAATGSSSSENSDISDSSDSGNSNSSSKRKKKKRGVGPVYKNGFISCLSRKGAEKEKQHLQSAVHTPDFHLLHAVRRGDEITFFLNGVRLGTIVRDFANMFTEMAAIGNQMQGGKPSAVIADFSVHPKPLCKP